MALTFEEYWPRWPADTQGQLLLELYVKSTVSELMQLLWSPDSAFTAEANAQRNFFNCHCTDWVNSETELPDLPGGFDWTYERRSTTSSIGNIHGKLRKVRFESSGGVMAPQGFKTEEVQRCLSYEENEGAIVDACVNSTAPFCENIRILCRYIIKELGNRRCLLSVSYRIVYVQAVNMLLKGFLEKGVKDGLMSNYNTYTKVLLTYVPYAAREGSVMAASDSDEDQEKVPNLPDLFPYESVVNWTALPLVAWMKALFHLPSRDFSWSLIRRFLKKTCIAVVYCLLVRVLFDGFMWIHDELISWKQIPDTLPQFNFQESLAVTVFFVCLMELAQLGLYFMKRILNWLRLESIYLVKMISWFQLRPYSLMRRHSIRRSFKNINDALHPDTQESDHESDSSALMGNEDDKETDASSIFQRVVNGFWTLIYYNSPDFHKFDHAVSIEKRTNLDGSVVEEVFENERLQPFRGWGHQWPGHFLPTDKFSHWSSFNANGDIVTCDDFQLIEPKLPPGWEWRDDDWQLDLSKLDIQAVDAQGWHYSLDFPWIKFTPERNDGIRRIHDFVRRRRFIRTRYQPKPSADQPAVSKNLRQSMSNSTSYFSFLNFL